MTKPSSFAFSILLVACATEDTLPPGGEMPGSPPGTVPVVDGSKLIRDLDAGEVQAVCDRNDATLEAEDLSGVWRFMCAAPNILLDTCTEAEIQTCLEAYTFYTPWILGCGLQLPEFERASCDVTVDQMFACWQTKKARMIEIAPAMTCGATVDYDEPAECTFIEGRCPTLADMLLL